MKSILKSEAAIRQVLASGEFSSMKSLVGVKSKHSLCLPHLKTSFLFFYLLGQGEVGFGAGQSPAERLCGARGKKGCLDLVMITMSFQHMSMREWLIIWLYFMYEHIS